MEGVLTVEQVEQTGRLRTLAEVLGRCRTRGILMAGGTR